MDQRCTSYVFGRGELAARALEASQGASHVLELAVRAVSALAVVGRGAEGHGISTVVPMPSSAINTSGACFGVLPLARGAEVAASEVANTSCGDIGIFGRFRILADRAADALAGVVYLRVLAGGACDAIVTAHAELSRFASRRRTGGW